MENEINMGLQECMAFLNTIPENERLSFCFSFNGIVELTKATDFRIHFKERKVEFFNEKMVKTAEMFY